MKYNILTVIFLISHVSIASANCSTLASTFSEKPELMDVSELNLLKNCITSRLGEKQIDNGQRTNRNIGMDYQFDSYRQILSPPITNRPVSPPN